MLEYLSKLSSMAYLAISLSPTMELLLTAVIIIIIFILLTPQDGV